MVEKPAVQAAVKTRPRRERSNAVLPGMTITFEYGDDPDCLANTLRWLLKQPIASPASQDSSDELRDTPR